MYKSLYISDFDVLQINFICSCSRMVCCRGIWLGYHLHITSSKCPFSAVKLAVWVFLTCFFLFFFFWYTSTLLFSLMQAVVNSTQKPFNCGRLEFLYPLCISVSWILFFYSLAVSNVLLDINYLHLDFLSDQHLIIWNCWKMAFLEP